MKYFILILFTFFGCNDVSDKSVQSHDSYDASIVTWRVDSLSIPICKLCDEAQMKLNLLFHEEVSVGDKIVLSGEKLLHTSIQGDTLRINKYALADSLLTIHGSDWVDMANIVKLNDKIMILKQAQTVVTKVDSQPLSNDLIIYLTKE